MLARRSLLALMTSTAVGTALAACAPADPTPGSSPDPAALTPAAPAPTPKLWRYGEHPSQFAELTLPAGSGPAPVVVVVHGGFWQTAYGAELGRPLAADLVTRGWATLNVEYRRVGSSRTAGGGGWPQTCEDVAAAVDLLATSDRALTGGRLDLSKVVGLGHSAGGQLVGWLAGRATLPDHAPGAAPVVPLTGFVAQAGVMDLVGAAEQRVGGSAVTDLMAGPPVRLAEAYSWASPLGRLPMRVPSVCVHGDRDDIVPLSQSERFVAEAQRLGDHSELRHFDGGHFDLITVGTTAWTMCLQAVTELSS